MVNPEIFATVTEDATVKSSTVLPPLTASVLAPGPVIVRFFVRAIGPLVRRMGEHDVTEGAKSMVPPALAAATSARSDPGPESLQLVTEYVAALATSAVSTVTDTAENTTTRLAMQIRSPELVRLRDAPELSISPPLFGRLASDHRVF
jgi:hypothetical protein